MKFQGAMRWGWVVIALCALVSSRSATVVHEFLSVAGKVEVARSGGNNWQTAAAGMSLNPGDRIRTGPDSRAQVRLSTRAVLPIAELTVITLADEQTDPDSSAFDLEIGRAFFLGNDKPGKVRFRTRSVAGSVRGTEFHLQVAGDGATTILLFDGAVELTNDHGRLALKSGEAATADPGKAPELRPMLTTRRVIQWYLHYPAIVARDDLIMLDGKFAEAADLYAQGDLVAAANLLPAESRGESDNVRLLRAASALSVGQLAKAERQLGSIETSEVADAMRLLIAIVLNTTPNPPRDWRTGSGWLAESYRRQAAFNLSAALDAAERAIAVDPDFGAGWIRVAELRFSFGRYSDAREALRKGLQLSPKNASAHAVEGFLLAAQNKFAEAESSFNSAIELDGSLATAWLGRGLLRMRRGENESGYKDLQTAAALDPQRAIMRSYLAKALDTLGGESVAVEQELARAMQLDPNDPTAWLYAALIHHRDNQINRAVRELEEARAKNDNRALFRSRMLLDEDRAINSANLAALYRAVGMTEVARREAAASVQADYSTHASHLFLANSYAELQDPRRANLRYENATVSEYLLANLLAPAGAGAFSPRISQEEYTRLFDRNRLGFVSQTDYESNGTWRQGAAQYGIFGGAGYALEQIYRYEAPPHVNGDVEQMSFSALFKQQLTPNDLIYVQSIYDWTETGDARQLDDPASALTSLRATDEQLPFLLAGYNHEWRPGVNTLVVGGFVNDDFHLSLDNQPIAAFGRSGDSITRVPVTQPGAPWTYRDSQKLYSVEAQQIFETTRNSLIGGLRYQTSTHNTDSALERSTVFQLRTASGIFPGTFRANTNSQSISEDFERISAYAYDTLELFENLFLTAGVSYDIVRMPQNFQTPPLTAGIDETDRISPKAGLLWRPTDKTLLRAAYSQSLGGASFDQSIRIEPTQVGGFNQAFRSLFPESLAGSVAGARFETIGAGFDQKIGNNLYLGLEAEYLKSKADRTFGTVDFQTTFPFSQTAGAATEQLHFRERSLLGTAHFLLGECVSLGVRHRVSETRLGSFIPQISAPFPALAQSEGLLNQTDLFAIINHPLGFFSELGATHYNQQTDNRPSGLEDDDFWQFDASIGWRSPRRNIEAMISLLNMTDQDYRLYPINLYRDPPRERTFAARLRLNF